MSLARLNLIGKDVSNMRRNQIYRQQFKKVNHLFLWRLQRIHSKMKQTFYNTVNVLHNYERIIY